MREARALSQALRFAHIRKGKDSKMAEKKFLEVFSRYKPTKEKRELLTEACDS